jgi:hypothetical protein
MDMETTEAKNILPEQDNPRKSGRPPPIVMTSTTNLIQLQSNLKNMSKESTSFETHKTEPVS